MTQVGRTDAGRKESETEFGRQVTDVMREIPVDSRGYVKEKEKAYDK